MNVVRSTQNFLDISANETPTLSYIDNEDGRGLKNALMSLLFNESIEANLDEPSAPATAYWAAVIDICY